MIKKRSRLRIFFSFLVWSFVFGQFVSFVFADSISETPVREVPKSLPSAETTTADNSKKTSDVNADNLRKYFEGLTVEPILNSFFVKGDRGRFRQDWWMDNDTTGGVKNLTFKGIAKDVRYEFEGHAIANYDYLSRLKAQKEDDYFLNAEWTRFRKYWDGAQDKDVWDPKKYNLSDQMRDWPEKGLYTDRGNVNVEFGKSISETAKLIVGYELWKREGRFPTLRGEQATRSDSGRQLRAIAMRTRVDGVSNTVSIRLPFTVDETHNFEPKISYEAYRDHQYTESSRYNASGILNQKRDYIDRPAFDDLKFQVAYNSFLSDDVYAHGGYYFDFLRNDSTRSEVRPNLAAKNTYVYPKVDNWRVSNVLAAGTALLDFLKKKGLDARFGFRGEQAGTKAQGSMLVDGITNRSSDSSLNEGSFGEVLSLTYRGLKKTTAFLELAMEQRVLDWKETFDARNHEIFSKSFGRSVAVPHYQTDITYINFVPTFKLARRLTSYLTGHFQYRWKSKQRRYNTVEDNNPRYYPGILGDQYENVQEVTTKADIKLPGAWISTLKYQMMIDDIDASKVEVRMQNLDRNTFSATFSGPVVDKVFMYFSGSYEIYNVGTPTFPNSNRWAHGRGEYNFNGDYFILSMNPSYQITKKISTFANYQITNSLGDNTNVLNEAGAGFKFKINDTTSLDARYQYFYFDDRRSPIDGGSGKGLDGDYQGQGMTFMFTKAFT